MNIQKLILVGRAVNDAKVVNEKLGTFSVAVNRFVAKEQHEVTFYECLTFGEVNIKRLENLKKGDIVVVEGRPEAEAYLSKDKKEAKAQLKVICDNWQIAK